jgi:omega-6 fatty acid desaturase (delta-12 desaturase)
MSGAANWNRRLTDYTVPSARRSIVQLAATLSAFIVTMAAARVALAAAWQLSALFSVASGLLLVRLFIVQHDCGHRSFLRSQAACDWIGRCLSLLTLTPYDYWRRDHDKHHATSGNLDRRGAGDITTLTVAEYRALPFARRLAYRLYRHPAILLGIGPAWQFLIRFRLPIGLQGKTAHKSRWSILLTNLFLAVFFGGLGWVTGYGALAAIWLPAVIVAGTAGIWLFYVQHTFEHAYWEHHASWSYVDAALRGCSYYRLPGWLHWLTGWIGYHHIHHLSARIPNYRLAAAFRDVPELQCAPSIGILESLGCLRLALWCEDRKRLISFREALG